MTKLKQGLKLTLFYTLELTKTLFYWTANGLIWLNNQMDKLQDRLL